MEETYLIKIKKSYAADVIKDLEKMEAVEVMTDENIDIPEWQVNLVMEEREKIEKDPSLLVDWEEAKKKIKRS